MHVEDIAMSSPTNTQERLHSPTQSATANPAMTPKFLTTPKRPAPNSAKKRRQMPDLSRPTATPGHGAKMSMIFRDAANSLQGSGISPNHGQSNIKKSRLPISQARGTKFGSSYADEIHRPSGAGPHYSTPTHLPEDDLATRGTTTDQSLGAATDVGDMCLDNTLMVSDVSPSSHIEEEGREPISSGFATPTASIPNFAEDTEEVIYPILEHWRSLRSLSNASSFGSDNDDIHSTHGVPLILPFPCSYAEQAPRSDIDTWLNGVAEAASSGLSSSQKQSYDRGDVFLTDAPFSQSIAPNLPSPFEDRATPSKLKQDMQSRSRASSDQENTGPSKYPSSPTHPLEQNLRARTPSRFCQTNTQATLPPIKPLHFAHSATPKRHLSLPPQRKRARVDGTTSSRGGAEMPTPRRDFTIHEDQVAEALAQLSPDVERHRKGRGPRRERCVSYWDEDILRPGLQSVPMDVDGGGETTRKGKEVLGGSEQADGSGSGKLFPEEVGSASFRFEA